MSGWMVFKRLAAGSALFLAGCFAPRATLPPPTVPALPTPEEMPGVEAVITNENSYNGFDISFFNICSNFINCQ